MKKQVALLFILFAFASGWAQAQPLHRYEYTHPQMGTTFRLIFYAPDSLLAYRAQARAFAWVDSLNAIMSDYLPESELNRLCATSSTGQWVSVSQPLFDVLEQSDYFARQSEGAFDVTVGALTRLWRRSRNLRILPDSVHLAAARSATGYQFIALNKHGRQVRLITNEHIQIDLGGIGQGYAADACLRILRSMGIPRALADAGGDIAVGDRPPDADGWKVAFVTAAGPQTLTLTRCGITTSGTTHKYWEHNGQRYAHIIDPRTGWPITYHRLVTVKAANATTADAWATALSVLGATWWQQHQKRRWRLRVWIANFPL